MGKMVSGTVSFERKGGRRNGSLARLRNPDWKRRCGTPGGSETVPDTVSHSTREVSGRRGLGITTATMIAAVVVNNLRLGLLVGLQPGEGGGSCKRSASAPMRGAS